jgi:hypothetical protein
VVAQEGLPVVPSELIVGEYDFMRVDCDKARYVEVAGTLTDPLRNKHCREKSESWLFVPSTTKADRRKLEVRRFIGPSLARSVRNTMAEW